MSSKGEYLIGIQLRTQNSRKTPSYVIARMIKKFFCEKKTSPYPTAAGNDILFPIEYAIENNEIILH